MTNREVLDFIKFIENYMKYKPFGGTENDKILYNNLTRGCAESSWPDVHLIDDIDSVYFNDTKRRIEDFFAQLSDQGKAFIEMVYTKN